MASRTHGFSLALCKRAVIEGFDAFLVVRLRLRPLRFLTGVPGVVLHMQMVGLCKNGVDSHEAVSRHTPPKTSLDLVPLAVLFSTLAVGLLSQMIQRL